MTYHVLTRTALSAQLWSDLRSSARTPTLFDMVVANDIQSVGANLNKATNPVMASAGLFYAHISDNPLLEKMLFPYASTAGIEAGRACLVASSFIDNIQLFNDTALWLKKRGESALAKSEVRNMCALNFAAFNRTDALEQLTYLNKSRFKNPTAIAQYFQPSIATAARFGSKESAQFLFEYMANHFKEIDTDNYAVCVKVALHSLSRAKQSYSASHQHLLKWLLEVSSSKQLYHVLDPYGADVDCFVQILQALEPEHLDLLKKRNNDPAISVLPEALEVLAALAQNQRIHQQIDGERGARAARKI